MGGETPYENGLGEKLRTYHREFVKLVCVPPYRDDHGKCLAKWRDGIPLEFNMETGEELVGTPEGVFNVRQITTMPVDPR